jgi:hypothetical protein
MKINNQNFDSNKKLHVYIVLKCSDCVDNNERIISIFLQKDIAERQKEFLSTLYPNRYYAVLKKTIKGKYARELSLYYSFLNSDEGGNHGE